MSNGRLEVRIGEAKEVKEGIGRRTEREMEGRRKDGRRDGGLEGRIKREMMG